MMKQVKMATVVTYRLMNNVSMQCKMTTQKREVLT